jgi:uncharacterized protein
VIGAIGTYLPTWSTDGRDRAVGADEDVVTLAVAAGRAALAAAEAAHVTAVVLVSRELPLLEGGNGAALLAGLGLPDSVMVQETLGGAPAALAAVTGASAGTLVIGADLEPAGASAVLVSVAAGAMLTRRAGVTRSLPVTSRDAHGGSTDYADPRLLRERGVGLSTERIGLTEPAAAVAGLVGKAAASMSVDGAPAVPTLGASAVGFALAGLAEHRAAGPVVAVEQASMELADLEAGVVPVRRDERPSQPAITGTTTPGADIAISLAAYERAFDVKLRLEAARCTSCATLSVPPRHRCLGCGSEEPTETVPLPRDATVHSHTTIHVPVPGKRTPYTLVIAQVGDTDVRLLVHLTDTPAGEVSIDDAGTLVFRRVAVRSGIPDYGYAFLPDATGDDEEVSA